MIIVNYGGFFFGTGFRLVAACFRLAGCRDGADGEM